LVGPWKTATSGPRSSADRPRDILVTGSARLDIYKRGGESLLGRQIGFRLHPFSLGETERSEGAPPDAVLAEVFEARRT